MKSTDSRSITHKPQRRPTENAVRLHQIDAEIMRLTRQLECLRRVRQQYGYMIDTGENARP